MRRAVSVKSGSQPTVSVSGLPKGLAYDKTANVIYGTPTKTATAKVKVTVKNLGGYKIVRTYEVKVVSNPQTTAAKVLSDDKPYAAVTAKPSDDAAGKVTGAGLYQAGKKVTLKATANKGYVFSGWATDDFTVTNQAASLTFTMGTKKVRAYAKFVTAGEDQGSIVTAANGTELFATEKDVACLATNVMCGVALRWPVAASALSLPTVKVSGLPSGLKFNAKDGMIVGAPTKAGSSKVKVTVTTAGKSKRVCFLAPDLTAKYPNLTLTAKKGGILTIAGKVGDIKVSGSSQIYRDVLEEELVFRAVIYVPSKKGFDGVAEVVAVEF